MGIAFVKNPRFLVGVGGVLTVLSVGVVTVKVQGDRSWGRLEARLLEMQQEQEQIDYVREPLGGPGEPGLAWDGYWGALEELASDEAVIELYRSSIGGLEGEASERRQATARLVEAMESELELVRRGARSRDAAPRIAWAMGDEQKTPLLMHTSGLANVMTLRGLELCEEGRVEEGLAMILDCLQMAEDFSRSPKAIERMIGLAIVIPHHADVYWRTEGFKALPREALVGLERGLGVVLDRMDWDPDFQGDLVLTGNALLRMDRERGGCLGWPSFDLGLPMALAPRWTVGQGFLEVIDQCQELKGLRGEALLAESHELSEGDKLFGQVHLIHRSMKASYRYQQVRLQWLRRALRSELGLEEIEFVDPHGFPLEEIDEEDHFGYSVAASSTGGEVKLLFRR